MIYDRKFWMSWRATLDSIYIFATVWLDSWRYELETPLVAFSPSVVRVYIDLDLLHTHDMSIWPFLEKFGDIKSINHYVKSNDVIFLCIPVKFQSLQTMKLGILSRVHRSNQFKSAIRYNGWLMQWNFTLWFLRCLVFLKIVTVSRSVTWQLLHQCSARHNCDMYVKNYFSIFKFFSC